ncbi:MAG: D-glycero-beta-D-manno-heptose 1-phosphate adenylyltransferase [Chitinophagales bacterium]|nr:D-glycero-beta-D-manno-heptose 1-phosphate adenylyltransferase [Chitinophagales bacterium]
MKLDTIQNKVFADFNSIEKKLNQWKFFGEKIVFSYGCYDMMNARHLAYLSKASEMGTKLIIGLNSDHQEQLLNSEKPLNAQFERALVLASLMLVDAVVLYDDKTPLNLILQIKPDVLVKGSNYRLDQIVGAQEVIAFGGEVNIID